MSIRADWVVLSQVSGCLYSSRKLGLAVSCVCLHVAVMLQLGCVQCPQGCACLLCRICLHLEFRCQPLVPPSLNSLNLQPGAITQQSLLPHLQGMLCTAQAQLQEALQGVASGSRAGWHEGPRGRGWPLFKALSSAWVVFVLAWLPAGGSPPGLSAQLLICCSRTEAGLQIICSSSLHGLQHKQPGHRCVGFPPALLWSTAPHGAPQPAQGEHLQRAERTGAGCTLQESAPHFIPLHHHSYFSPRRAQCAGRKGVSLLG